MTTQISTEDNAGPEPVACALTSAGRAAQRDSWERLADRAMTQRATTADGLRLAFRLEPGVEQELRALVAVEDACCPWAAWTVQANAGQVVLDVRSTGAGIAVLHGMFASPRPGADQRPHA